MSDTDLHADDDRFHGTVTGKDLLELLKMLHRTCASGVLHLDAGANRASLCLDQGAIRAAFFNALLGPPALTRIILIGEALFRFELGTAHTVSDYAANIGKDTALILSTVEAMLSEQQPVTVAIPLPATAASAPAATATYEADPLPQDASPHSELPISTLRLAAFAPPEPGVVIGKCELKAEIGRGASSVVYRAFHRSLGLDVVVKVLMQGDSDDTQHRLLTINEARLLARLNHPNILRIFDFSDTGLHPHLVMEFVDGPSLDRLIINQRQLPTDVALPLFCQVVEALSYAYATLGLIHCDIKPTNILLTTGMQAKLADFGLAKAGAGVIGIAGLPATDTVAGTPSYIAPEQVRGGRAACDHRSDIYSLGATLYHAVTGRTPFSDPDPVQLMVKRLSEAPIPPHLVNPKIERRLSQLIMSMMARDPANRVQTYDELLELLSDLFEASLLNSERRRSNSTEDEGKVIRRRTSFWNYVPNRLFRRASSEGGKDVG